MNELTDVPESDVPRVVKEALRDDASEVQVTKQPNGKFTVRWE